MDGISRKYAYISILPVITSIFTIIEYFLHRNSENHLEKGFALVNLVFFFFAMVFLLFSIVSFFNEKNRIFNRYCWIYPPEKRNKELWKKFIEDHDLHGIFFTITPRKQQNEETWKTFINNNLRDDQ